MFFVSHLVSPREAGRVVSATTFDVWQGERPHQRLAAPRLIKQVLLRLSLSLSLSPSCVFQPRRGFPRVPSVL